LSLRTTEGAISLTSGASCCRAFLCNQDGQVIHDFGEQRPDSSESISARSLLDLMDARGLADFLEIVRTRGVTLGWEMRVYHGGSARRLLLHGFQTPCGALVFAPLASLEAGETVDSHPVTDPGTHEDEEGATDLVEAAHDLQNPISSLISACEYLATYTAGNLTPEQQEMIAGIESSAATVLLHSRRISELARRR
jgi:hypothetical protein